jgi:uncharacterized membrane protein
MVEIAPPPLDPPPTERDVPANHVSATTGLPRNIASGLAMIFPLIGGIIFLVLERKDQFVRLYAIQSVLLGGIAVMFSLAVAVVTFIFSHIPLVGVLLNAVLNFINYGFSLAWFVIYVVAIVKAFWGQEWLIPYLGQVAKRQAGVPEK